MSVYGGSSIAGDGASSVAGDQGRWPGDLAGDYSLFLVEHLATFTGTDLQTPPNQVLDRLLRSPPQHGIWTREKLQVRVDTEHIRYLNPQDGKVLEKFPLTLIHVPTYAFQLSDPQHNDVNNVLMFAFASPSGGPEMHILQCLNADATHVSEDVNAAVKAAVELQSLESRNDTAADRVKNRHKQFASLLNRCFDDIESFVAKIQEASQRPVQIQGNRNEPVQYSLVLPPQKDFIDIYQKHKFCFNLIAKMKESLTSPNGPDLTHVLFNTLKIILGISQDYRLPTTVISPILTQDAVDFLYSCLKSEQVVLWHSLGDAWNIPRDKWTGYVAPFHPIFLDGWMPDFPVDEENVAYSESQRASSPAPSDAFTDLLTSPSTAVNGSRKPDWNDDSKSRQTKYSGGSESQVDNIPKATRSRKPRWVDDLKSRDVKVLEVLESKVGKEARELTVVKGELLEMLSNDRSHGIWCTNSEEQFGFVDPKLVAIYHFDHPGGRQAPVKEERRQAPVKEERRQAPVKEEQRMAAPPPPPAHAKASVNAPPPPPPPPAYTDDEYDTDGASSRSSKSEKSTDKHKKRGQVLYRSESQQDLVLAELSSVLNELDRKKPFVKKTPEVYISKYSTPEEVQEWLDAKDFGADIQKKLRTCNGDSLFQLRKDQCEKKFGKEGSRLYSQITVQRNINGYSTVNNRNNELNSFLEKARQKADEKSPKKAGSSKSPRDYDDGSSKKSSSSRNHRDYDEYEDEEVDYDDD